MMRNEANSQRVLCSPNFVRSWFIVSSGVDVVHLLILLKAKKVYLWRVVIIEIGYIEGERVIKINFGFMYSFTNSWPYLSRRDSAKITTVQIFPAAWAGRRSLCIECEWSDINANTHIKSQNWYSLVICYMLCDYWTLPFPSFVFIDRNQPNTFTIHINQRNTKSKICAKKKKKKREKSHKS